MSEAPVKPEHFTEQEEGEPSSPLLDVAQLKRMVEVGEVPASLLGLYQEMNNPLADQSFVKTFDDAEQERQEKILRALQRTADKLETNESVQGDEKFKLSLMTFIAFVYAMLLSRSMKKGITADSTLDPGKNEEGAWLRILETNGNEVFADPEKFGIKDLSAFLKKIIYAGHGREVLEHITQIPPAEHSALIFECLQISRQKNSNLEAAYVIETLPKCKELSLDVAKQLCRLGYDHEVGERITSYREPDVQDVILLLIKRKKMTLREIFSHTVEISHPLLLKQVLVSVCYLNKKMFAELHLPENEDVLKLIVQSVPSIEARVRFLERAKNNPTLAVQVEIIPDKKYLAVFSGLRKGSSYGHFTRLEYIQTEVMRELTKNPSWKELLFPSLHELGDESAECLSKSPLETLVRIGGEDRVTKMSPTAEGFFEENRGWFLFDDQKSDYKVRGDTFATEVARTIDLSKNQLTRLSAASAKRLVENPRKIRTDEDGRMAEYRALSLGGLTFLKYEAASVLVQYPGPVILEDLVELSGYQMPKQEPFPELFFKSFPVATRIAPFALKSAIIYAMKKGEKAIALPLLTSLTDETARILMMFDGDIELPAIRSITATQAALLAGHEGGNLSLRGFVEMKTDVAEALSAHNGGLDLSYVQALNDDCAKALAKHKGGELNLVRVHDISVEAVEKLSHHEGELVINPIKDKTTRKRDLLFQNRGWYPSEVSPLSDRMAAAEAQNIRIKTDRALPLPFLKLLEQNYKHETLYLDSRTWLSEVELEWIATSCPFPISLKGLKRLTLEQAKYLGQCKQKIYFYPEIKDEDGAFAEMKEAWLRDNEQDGIDYLPLSAIKYLKLIGTPKLYFGQMSSINLLRAQALRGYEGDLRLPHVQSITSNVLEILSEGKGTIFLDGLKEFPEEAIKYFRDKPVKLSLRGLTVLTLPVAKLLVSQHERIIFTDLVNVDVDVLCELARNNELVNFHKKKEISLYALKHMRKSPHDRVIYLDAVEKITTSGVFDGEYPESQIDALLDDPQFSFKFLRDERHEHRRRRRRRKNRDS